MTEDRHSDRPSWYTGAPNTGASEAGSPEAPAPGGPASRPRTAAEAGGYGIGPSHGRGHANFRPSPAYDRPRYGSGYDNGFGSPYGPGSYDSGHHSYTPGADSLEAMALERERRAREHANTALILGMVGLFVLGFILGPMAIWQAAKARSMGYDSAAPMVLGVVTTVWAFSGWWIFFFIIIGIIAAI